MPAKLRVVRDNTSQVASALKGLAQSRVLVGIPEDKAPRRDQAINNATLMFIHTNGSPARGIPARPVLEPAIRDSGNKQKIARQMEAAAAAALDEKSGEVARRLQAAGLAGQVAAQGWFTNPRNGWAQNTPETIARKLGKLSGSDRAKAFAQLEMGTAADIAALDTPLIDTGALRQSITFVVEQAGKSQVQGKEGVTAAAGDAATEPE